MQVVVYGTDTCPFCVKAERLLKREGIEYTKGTPQEYRRTYNIDELEKFTIPRIVIDGELIGGYDELLAKLTGAL